MRVIATLSLCVGCGYEGQSTSGTGSAAEPGVCPVPILTVAPDAEIAVSWDLHVDSEGNDISGRDQGWSVTVSPIVVDIVNDPRPMPLDELEALCAAGDGLDTATQYGPRLMLGGTATTDGLLPPTLLSAGAAVHGRITGRDWGSEEFLVEATGEAVTLALVDSTFGR